AIVDNIDIVKLLLEYHADPNQQDTTGGTALHWAAENNNLALCELLLKSHANPNAVTFAGQPVLVMPLLRRQQSITKLLYQYGADQLFTQDFINTKLLGHVFELVGTANIVNPSHQFVEVDFEGFFIEVTLALIANSLYQFQHHFAARTLRHYAGLTYPTIEALQRASEIIKYQQYRVDIRQHREKINTLLQKEPLIIPIGYEGHAITFIKQDNIIVKCDRREESRLYDNVMFYRITQPEKMHVPFIMNLIYEKQSGQFINEELLHVLGLQPFTDLKIEAQISGNCSWANVEACIPAIFLLLLIQADPQDKLLAHYKTLALKFFHHWRSWNKNRALKFCIQTFKETNTIRKACKAEVLAAILFQHANTLDKESILAILELFIHSPYEYILRNYLHTYYYNNPTEEGKYFAELLKMYDYLK
ncbi:MAG: Ankyrin repeat protein, partial [uncultured bacterium]